MPPVNKVLDRELWIICKLQQPAKCHFVLVPVSSALELNIDQLRESGVIKPAFEEDAGEGEQEGGRGQGEGNHATLLECKGR